MTQLLMQERDTRTHGVDLEIIGGPPIYFRACYGMSKSINILFVDG